MPVPPPPAPESPPHYIFPQFPTQTPATKLSYDLAEAFVICTTIAQFLATVLLLGRIWTRATPVWRFKIDDYLICLGYAFGTVVYSLMIVAESFSVGHGRPEFRKMSHIKTTIKMATLTMPFWAWGIGTIKISIACMLLRFLQSKGWRIAVYVLIGLNIVLILFSGVVTVFQCMPYNANWDFSIREKKCWGVTMSRICLFLASSLHIFTDVVTSLIPLTFIRKIRKPTKDKVIIAFLMALGLLVSALSLTKTIWGEKTRDWKDQSSFGIMTGLLSCLEVQTALIAACIPTLRGAGRRLLKKMGIMDHTASDRMSQYGEGSSLSGGPKGQSRFINLGRVHLTPGSRRFSTTEDTGTTQSTRETQSHRPFQTGTQFLSDSSSSPAQSEDRSMSSRQISTAATREEEIDSEANYQMDPKTGRITCTAEVRLHSSKTHLRDEWSHQAR